MLASNPSLTCSTSVPPPPPSSVGYHCPWQAAESDGKLVNTAIQTEIWDHRRLCRSAWEQIDLAVQPRSMSVGSVRLSPRERVDPGD